MSLCSQVRDVAVIITDAFSNVEDRNTVPEAEAAKARGIEIYTVGLGEYVNYNELNDMSSDPYQDHVFVAQDNTQAEAVADMLLDAICD